MPDISTRPGAKDRGALVGVEVGEYFGNIGGMQLGQLFLHHAEPDVMGVRIEGRVMVHRADIAGGSTGQTSPGNDCMCRHALKWRPP